MAHLKLVRGTPTPAAEVRRRIRKMPKPPDLIQCHRCGGREVIETKSGVLLQAGKTKGGTKMLLCAHCFMKGERVMLV